MTTDGEHIIASPPRLSDWHRERAQVTAEISQKHSERLHFSPFYVRLYLRMRIYYEVECCMLDRLRSRGRSDSECHEGTKQSNESLQDKTTQR
jgi:hypothetical protein